jgi:hypothetical protein
VTSIGEVLALTTFFSVVGVAIWRGWHEGLHQGAEPGDALVNISICGAEDRHLVEARVVNPASEAVVAVAASRWVGRLRPVAGVGGTTRRDPPSGDGGLVLPIARFAAETVSWTTSSPSSHGRLVVDVHVWQQRGRIRRHRRVVGLRPPQDAGVSATMASAERR